MIISKNDFGNESKRDSIKTDDIINVVLEFLGDAEIIFEHFGENFNSNLTLKVFPNGKAAYREAYYIGQIQENELGYCIPLYLRYRIANKSEMSDFPIYYLTFTNQKWKMGKKM